MAAEIIVRGACEVRVMPDHASVEITLSATIEGSFELPGTGSPASGR